jgi:hypothetical protein
MRPEEASVIHGSTNRTATTAKRLARATASLALLGVVLATPAACNQPQIRCTAALGEGIARYTVKGKVPTSCATSTLPGTTTPDPATFPLGVESYVPSPADPNAANEVNSMAIKAEWIGARIQEAQANVDGFDNYPYLSQPAPEPPPTGAPSTNFPFAWGTFDSVYPDANGVCHVSTMSASKMTYPDVPDHNQKDADGKPTGPEISDQPQTAVEYAWTNVRTYVAASSIGVQTFGDLTITQDDCAISYRVSILVPRVQCASADDPTRPDPTLCDPNPNGPNNPSGSGISEDVAPSCENISADPANPDFECLPPAVDPRSDLP